MRRAGPLAAALALVVVASSLPRALAYADQYDPYSGVTDHRGEPRARRGARRVRAALKTDPNRAMGAGEGANTRAGPRTGVRCQRGNDVTHPT